MTGVLDPASVDTQRFLELIRQARHAPEPAARLALLDEALALWCGDPLADVLPEELRERLCTPLREARMAARDQRARVLIETGAYDTALTDLGALTATYPLREDLVATHMTALHADAYDHFREAIELDDAAGRLLSASTTLLHLGGACRGLGRFAEAFEHVETAVARYESAGLTRGIGYCEYSFAQTHLALGHHDEAFTKLRRVLSIAADVGDLGLETAARNDLARTHLATNRPHLAVPEFEHAFALAAETAKRLRGLGSTPVDP